MKNQKLIYGLAGLAALFLGKKYLDSKKGSMAIGSKGKWLKGDPRALEQKPEFPGAGWAGDSELAAAKLRSIQQAGSDDASSGWGFSQKPSASSVRQLQKQGDGTASSGWGMGATSISSSRQLQKKGDGFSSGWGRVYGPTAQQLAAQTTAQQLAAQTIATPVTPQVTPQVTPIVQQTVVQQQRDLGPLFSGVPQQTPSISSATTLKTPIKPQD